MDTFLCITLFLVQNKFENLTYNCCFYTSHFCIYRSFLKNILNFLWTIPHPLEYSDIVTIVTSPPHLRSLWLQVLPPIFGGVDPLRMPPWRHRRQVPLLASFLGASLTRSLLVGTPPPNATTHHLPDNATMAQAPPPLPLFPYMVDLNFPNLSKLINDPIAHDPAWHAMVTKLPSDIPKFEGK